jgi:hypothetical protein
MKLSKTFTYFTVLRLTTAATFYPDWEGGSQTCLSDGAEPLYMTKASLLKGTLEECCAAYYNSEEQTASLPVVEPLLQEVWSGM